MPRIDYREEFIKTVRENIHREGIDQLLEWLDTTDFYKAPASTRFHSAFETGLVSHSLFVFKRLLAKQHNESTESIAICALFHDLCKANFYTVQMRNKKLESGAWVQTPFYSINDKFPFGHGEKSVYLILQFMKLTEEEALAIRWHMGGFGISQNSNECNALNESLRRFPLVLKLNEADMEASNWDEPWPENR